VQSCLLALINRTVADDEPQGAKLAFHGVAWRPTMCTRSASRLKRPGGSEGSVGEISTLLHGDLPGSYMTDPWRTRLSGKK
jgi:hypothetical protein